MTLKTNLADVDVDNGILLQNIKNYKFMKDFNNQIVEYNINLT